MKKYFLLSLAPILLISLSMQSTHAFSLKKITKNKTALAKLIVGGAAFLAGSALLVKTIADAPFINEWHAHHIPNQNNGIIHLEWRNGKLINPLKLGACFLLAAAGQTIALLGYKDLQKEQLL